MLDIRLIVALLMAIYGLVLTTLGLAFTPDTDITKSAGININLGTGLALLLLALLFTIWTKLRPLPPPPPS
jgi:hypothetical protein